MMKHTIIASVTAALLSLALALTPAFSFDHDGQDHSQNADALASLAESPAGLYRSEPTHAYITFTYNHLGFSNPIVSFKKFDARLDLDPARPEQSSVEVVIDAGSIESLVPKFNEHLRAADFFDVEKHPQITFRSTGGLKLSEDKGKMTGDLTIKGVTGSVTLDVLLNKAGVNPISKKHTLGVSARATLLRSDWGLDAYAPAVSDEVDLRLEIEFVKEE